jgi:hypothetical protein
MLGRMPPDALTWLNDNASAVQAVAGILSVVVAFIALGIAGLAWRAEKGQAEAARDALAEARRQAEAAAASEQARRWDERVQAVAPISVSLPDGPQPAEILDTDYAGDLLLVVTLKAPPSTPVLDARVILRRGPDDSSDAAMNNAGTLAAGEVWPAYLMVTDLVAGARAKQADTSHYRLIINWTGQLGQWVVQEYAYDFVNAATYDQDPMWRLVRWHVDPKVEGLPPLEVTFGPDAGHAGGVGAFVGAAVAGTS